MCRACKYDYSEMIRRQQDFAENRCFIVVNVSHVTFCSLIRVYLICRWLLSLCLCCLLSHSQALRDAFLAIDARITTEEVIKELVQIAGRPQEETEKVADEDDGKCWGQVTLRFHLNRVSLIKLTKII